MEPKTLSIAHKIERQYPRMKNITKHFLQEKVFSSRINPLNFQQALSIDPHDDPATKRK